MAWASDFHDLPEVQPCNLAIVSRVFLACRQWIAFYNSSVISVAKCLFASRNASGQSGRDPSLQESNRGTCESTVADPHGFAATVKKLGHVVAPNQSLLPAVAREKEIGADTSTESVVRGSRWLTHSA